MGVNDSDEAVPAVDDVPGAAVCSERDGRLKLARRSLLAFDMRASVSFPLPSRTFRCGARCGSTELSTGFGINHSQTN